MAFYIKSLDVSTLNGTDCKYTIINNFLTQSRGLYRAEDVTAMTLADVRIEHQNNIALSKYPDTGYFLIDTDDFDIITPDINPLCTITVAGYTDDQVTFKVVNSKLFIVLYDSPQSIVLDFYTYKGLYLGGLQSSDSSLTIAPLNGNLTDIIVAKNQELNNIKLGDYFIPSAYPIEGVGDLDEDALYAVKFTRVAAVVSPPPNAPPQYPPAGEVVATFTNLGDLLNSWADAKFHNVQIGSEIKNYELPAPYTAPPDPTEPNPADPTATGAISAALAAITTFTADDSNYTAFIGSVAVNDLVNDELGYFNIIIDHYTSIKTQTSEPSQITPSTWTMLASDLTAMISDIDSLKATVNTEIIADLKTECTSLETLLNAVVTFMGALPTMFTTYTTAYTTFINETEALITVQDNAALTYAYNNVVSTYGAILGYYNLYGNSTTDNTIIVKLKACIQLMVAYLHTLHTNAAIVSNAAILSNIVTFSLAIVNFGNSVNVDLTSVANTNAYLGVIYTAITNSGEYLSAQYSLIITVPSTAQAAAFTEWATNLAAFSPLAANTANITYSQITILNAALLKTLSSLTDLINSVNPTSILINTLADTELLLDEYKAKLTVLQSITPHPSTGSETSAGPALPYLGLRESAGDVILDWVNHPQIKGTGQIVVTNNDDNYTLSLKDNLLVNELSIGESNNYYTLPQKPDANGLKYLVSDNGVLGWDTIVTVGGEVVNFVGENGIAIDGGNTNVVTIKMGSEATFTTLTVNDGTANNPEIYEFPIPPTSSVVGALNIPTDGTDDDNTSGLVMGYNTDNKLSWVKMLAGEGLSVEYTDETAYVAANGPTAEVPGVPASCTFKLNTVDPIPALIVNNLTIQEAITGEVAPDSYLLPAPFELDSVSVPAVTASDRHGKFIGYTSDNSNTVGWLGIGTTDNNLTIGLAGSNYSIDLADSITLTGLTIENGQKSYSLPDPYVVSTTIPNDTPKNKALILDENGILKWQLPEVDKPILLGTANQIIATENPQDSNETTFSLANTIVKKSDTYSDVGLTKFRQITIDSEYRTVANGTDPIDLNHGITVGETAQLGAITQKLNEVVIKTDSININKYVGFDINSSVSLNANTITTPSIAVESSTYFGQKINITPASLTLFNNNGTPSFALDDEQTELTAKSITTPKIMIGSQANNYTLPTVKPAVRDIVMASSTDTLSFSKVVTTLDIIKPATTPSTYLTAFNPRDDSAITIESHNINIIYSFSHIKTLIITDFKFKIDAIFANIVIDPVITIGGLPSNVFPLYDTIHQNVTISGNFTYMQGSATFAELDSYITVSKNLTTSNGKFAFKIAFNPNVHSYVQGEVYTLSTTVNNAIFPINYI